MSGKKCKKWHEEGKESPGKEWGDAPHCGWRSKTAEKIKRESIENHLENENKKNMGNIKEQYR